MVFVLAPELDPSLVDLPALQSQLIVAMPLAFHRHQLVSLELPAVQRHDPDVAIAVEFDVVDLQPNAAAGPDLHDGFDLAYHFPIGFGFLFLLFEHVRVFGDIEFVQDEGRVLFCQNWARLWHFICLFLLLFLPIFVVSLFTISLFTISLFVESVVICCFNLIGDFL